MRWLPRVVFVSPTSNRTIQRLPRINDNSLLPGDICTIRRHDTIKIYRFDGFNWRLAYRCNDF